MRARLRSPLVAIAVTLALLSACSPAANTPSEETRTAEATPTAADSSPSPTRSATPSPTKPSGARSSPASPSPSPVPSGDPEADDVVTDLTTPWGLVPLRDGTMLVTERDTGRILHVRGSEVSELRRISAAQPGGEGGLLGLAIAPDQETVFAYYTAASDNRIVAMSWDGADLGRPDVIIDQIPKGFRHNGGRMVVGPDGFLYGGTGDAGDSSLSQDRGSLGGKILRLRLSGRPAPDNPFDNEVWSYGHRNVQGLAFDPEGRLWASEFGDQRWDEINLIRRGDNYGWPEVEGSGGGDRYVDPKVVWSTDDASPSGLAYWAGSLWMASLRGERLWEIPLKGAQTDEPQSHFRGDYGRLRTVEVASDAQSMFLGTSNTDGRATPGRGDDRIMRVVLR